MKDLSFLAEVYSNLVNPREESYFSNDINKKLIILKDLSAKTFYPILLALTKQNFEDKEILKILSVLEVLVVRNFVVAQKVANIYELEFSKIAFKISQEKLIKIDDIIQEINKWIVSDDDFKQAFSTFEIKNKSAIRYILKMIDSSISLVASEMKIIDDNVIVNIEHILPVDYSLWKDVTIDFHDEYLWRLGNLSLLGSEFNKKCSNYPFEQKK